MPLATGIVLNGRYRIVNLLGQGGFGAVYRSWDINLSRACALKENLDTSAEAHRQFEREAQILAALAHPGLPRVIDHFTIPGQGQYLVMDYVEGEDLGQILERGTGALSESQVVAWITQVCEALTYLHSQKMPVIHRDIKPANIRITPDGQAMLVDFGIAKIYDPNLSTTKGARAVTPGYSPPEQYGSGKTTAQSDVYALGATTYHLLTGQAPVESVQRMMGSVLKNPRDLNPDLSLGVIEAVLKAMSPMLEDRYSSAADFALALKQGQLPKPADTAVMRMGNLATQAAPQAAAIHESSISTAAGLGLPGSKPRKQDNSFWSRFPLWVAGLGMASVFGMCLLLIAVVANLTRSPTPDARLTVDNVASTAELSDLTAQEQPTEIFSGTQKPSLAPTIPEISPLTSQAETPTLVPSETVPAQATISGDIPPKCLTIGERWVAAKDGMTLLCIPAGDFLMGADPARDADAEADELPQHKVYIDAFWMDLTEVTNAMFAACVRDGACQAPAKDSSFTHSKYYSQLTYANYPVLHTTYDQAQAYCKWRGGRLPTEAEWEKAARGTEARIFPWGNQFDGRSLNFCDKNCSRRKPNAEFDDGFDDTAPVGSYPNGASPYGLFDMAGNVWEFVLDWYSETFYAGSPANNPFGPNSGEIYVVRGGAWDSRISIVRTTTRFTIKPEVSLDYVGFRCMLSSP